MYLLDQMLQKLVKVKELPPSNRPTCLPCEKCIDRYKVLGSRLSFPARAHESYSIFDVKLRRCARSEAGGKILLRQMSRSPFIGCLILLSLCQSAARTHTLFLSLSAAKSLFTSPQISPSGCSGRISEAASVQKPHCDRRV